MQVSIERIGTPNTHHGLPGSPYFKITPSGGTTVEEVMTKLREAYPADTVRRPGTSFLPDARPHVVLERGARSHDVEVAGPWQALTASDVQLALTEERSLLLLIGDDPNVPGGLILRSNKGLDKRTLTAQLMHLLGVHSEEIGITAGDHYLYRLWSPLGNPLPTDAQIALALGGTLLQDPRAARIRPDSGFEG